MNHTNHTLQQHCLMCCESERDRLKTDLIDARNLYQANTKNAFEEIDRLKAEINVWAKSHAQEFERANLWKSRAERLAEAATICCETLRELDELNWEPQGRPFNWDQIMDKTEALLAEFEKESLPKGKMPCPRCDMGESNQACMCE